MFPAVIDKKVIILFGLGNTAEITGTGLRIDLRRALLSTPLKRLTAVD